LSNRPSNVTTFEDSFSEEVWRNTFKDYNDIDINDTFWRVSKAIASVEETDELKETWANNFYDMLSDFKVVPGGRIQANAGTDFKGTSLVNCTVGPNSKYDMDSLSGILQLLSNQATSLKAECGFGNNFSFIRPRGTFINGIGVETPGSVRFMELFDKSSEIITSGSGKKSINKKAKGKIRKGALMGVLDCWHPDIIEFITAKQNAGKLSKFNLSVNCSDKFMNKVLEVDELKKKSASREEIDKITWDLIFPVTTHEKYKSEWFGDIEDWTTKGYPINILQTVKVEWLWDLITQSTFNRNEPGILFLDRANYFNQLNYKEHINACNPCVAGDMLVSVIIKGKAEKICMRDLVELWKSDKSIKVKGYNEQIKTIDYFDITNACLTKSNAKILKITDSISGKSIRVTSDHKVFTENRGYVEAQYLKSTDILKLN